MLVMTQDYYTDIRFHRIEKDGLYFFFANATREGLTLLWKKISRALCTWLMDKYPGSIDTTDFDEDALENQYKAL